MVATKAMTRGLLGMAVAAAALGLAACSGGMGGGYFSASTPAAPPTQVLMSPVVTADGTQQFAVPPDGRAVLRQKLAEYIQGPVQDARLSNGWRTAAGAQQKPNDYAACVAAVAGGQTRYFLIVVSGAGVSGTVTGDPAAQKCNDPARVVQWVPFAEAMAPVG